MTYKAACTMNMERMFHVKIFYNRKQGITLEEFNSYWANNHSALAEPFHLRLGVVKYSQLCKQFRFDQQYGSFALYLLRQIN